ncbi:MAG TPA: aminodeoxychorismate/anthranilate synthase component II [candidate division Zixibacteria bacterium]|nr:aminodeoxychorismate/anthranilate synthase component II [candidate division Zixibacteria bacterium]
MILIIDNYDSFTWNLAQYVGEFGKTFQVVRNDEITLDEAKKLNPTHLIISPGPGRPEDAGISCKLISFFSGMIPILGVCLGHQCIAHAFGGRIENSAILMHGKTSKVFHNGTSIYNGIPNPFEATRYHSLMVGEKALPKELQITAHTSDGEIMGIKMNDLPVDGVQFHPESILTKHGRLLISNFLGGRR